MRQDARFEPRSLRRAVEHGQRGFELARQTLDLEFTDVRLEEPAFLHSDGRALKRDRHRDAHRA